MRKSAALLLAASLLAGAAIAEAAQAPAPQPAIAAAKLPTVTDVPRYFKVVSVTLPAGANSSVYGPAGMLYQVSGSTLVSLGGEAKTVNTGEGIYIPSGTQAQLQAGAAGPSTFFHYFLASAADLDRPAEIAPAAVKEIYRSNAPIPDLKPGTYDVSLTRGTFAPQMALGGAHYRSGAALYYIVSGTAQNTIDGRTMPRPAGTFVYEPYGMVHQWANPSNEPVNRIVFNINPEGTPPVVQGTPPK